MRLGLANVLPRDLRDLDLKSLQQVRAAGFTGAAVSLEQHPAEVSPELIQRTRELYAEAGVQMVELGQYQSDLIHPDAAVRGQWIRQLQQALRVAQALGGPAVITGSGSRNPKSAWFAHRDNHTQPVLKLLIESLKEAVKAAEEYDTILALECHTATALKDPETTLQVLEAVGSPRLKVHLDPVNWITFATYFDNGRYIERMLKVLGPHLLGCHAKDVVLEDRLIVHLDEAPAGQGVLDYHTLLRELARIPGDPWLVIEHTPPEQVAAARAYVVQRAAEAGITFN